MGFLWEVAVVRSHSHRERSRSPAPALLLLLVALVLAGCTQRYATVEQRAIALNAGDLESGGVAFITPSTVTTQEEEKQAVALIFAEVLRRERPKVRAVTLPETLSAVNRAGLAEEYKAMYADYRDTGLFKRDMLRKVGELTGARYVAQLKLQGWGAGAKERFGALGFRILETKTASARIFLQVWDSRDGTIAWEGINEVNFSQEDVREKSVTLKETLELAAQELLARLP
jgi:hypothetical protein